MFTYIFIANLMFLSHYTLLLTSKLHEFPAKMLHTITKGWFLQSCPYTLTPNVNIIALISRGTCIHPDTTQWRLKRNKLKVLVIQRDLIIPYKNSRNEGTFLTIILLDEEVTTLKKNF